VGAQNISSAWY